MNSVKDYDKDSSRFDEEERAWRSEVLDQALQLYAEDGFRLDRRCHDLCEAFRCGRIELEELRHEVLRPFVH